MNIPSPSDGANGFDPDFADPPQWAAMYRAHRFQVVPAWSPDEHKQWKRPKVPRWRELQDVLIPQSQFDYLWHHNATRRNMGLITGPCSDGVFIVDLDTQKGPEATAWWNGLLAVHNNDMPLETCEQRTGGGGRQLLFRAPAGVTVPTCKTARGVDIRGQGGFAMLPPSMHESGREYAWLPGQAPGEIDIATAPIWLLEAIAALVREHGGQSGDNNGQKFGSSPTADPAVAIDPFGNVADGREQVMRDVVWHAVLELKRTAPMRHHEDSWPALAEAAYEEYERKVTTRVAGVSLRDGLEQEGRGPTLFWQKFRATMGRWDDADFIREAEKPALEPAPESLADEFSEQATKAEQQARADPGKLFKYLDINQIMDMPDPLWHIHELVNENSLGFIYGPPGSLKTFLALDIALSLATRQRAWWGRDICHHGAVVYICREGVSSLKFRIAAWEAHRGVAIRDIPFYLIEQTINFMKGEDIGTLVATVGDIAAKAAQPITAVFVDTISRVLPGAEENQQKDMTLFVGACDVLKQEFHCTVFGVHHTNAMGKFRGSTVMPGAGDFMIETRREPGAMTGSIFAFKIKDAEDGWEQVFKVVKVPIGVFGTQSSLALDPADAEVASNTGDGLPERSVCLQILAAIDEQWASGRPWCYAKNTSRSAVTNICRRWGIDRPGVIKLLEIWTANRVIEEQCCDAQSHIMGYRKLIDL